MLSMSPQKSNIHDILWSPPLYSIAAAVTTIAISLVFFRKFCKIRTKSREISTLRQRQPSRDGRISIPRPQLVDYFSGDERHLDIPVPPQAPSTTLEPQFINKSAKEKRNFDSSVPVQASTTSRPQVVDQSLEDEGLSGVPVPRGPPTTSELQTLGNKDGPNRKAARESRLGILIPSSASNNSPLEARNEDDNEIPNLVTLEDPFNDRGGEDVQSRSTAYGLDTNFSVPKEVPSTTELHSIDSGNRIVKAPSTSFFQGSSNVKITSSNFYEVYGNATINRFGDGQFTDVQRNLICDYIANLTVLPGMKEKLKKHVLTQSIISLSRAEAVFNDYQTKKRSGPCFEGTRVALLREMADWITWAIGPGASRVYVLSGLAGIGKTTVAYTIASRAADLHLLGASFFFSRDEADRNNAKKFFTTIAYQLCVYDETFSKAIGDILLTEHGSAATTKDPHDQLQALILEPLRSIAQSRSRPVLIVVDALDECDEEDAFSVLAGLGQLVRDLPSFKVILTTRPQSYLDRFLVSRDGHQIFRLQDIEDKVVDHDVRLYLNYNLSLEQVQKHYPMWQWCASDEEVESLVRIVGRLFIIASTAVRYIFDKVTSNPAAQMQKLLHASAQDHIPFEDLNHFYTIILRNVVPANYNDNEVVSRYQSVVGAIILVQHPLPVSTLAHLIDMDMAEIRSVLDNLQSVILLGSDDVPHIYHKSFPDFLMDHCNDPCLRIDKNIRHTQIAMRCFETMNKHLKRNILDLGNPARFMSNKDGLEKDRITDKQLQKKIPQQLHYACKYWANHLEVANMKDEALMKILRTFVEEHMLHWFEVLSLIGKLDSAHHAIRVVLKLLKSTSSDLHQLLSDAIRFISRFYEPIERSALHTYYSALSVTPTDSPLYRRYNRETVDNIFAIEGGPEQWDALIANLRHEERDQFVKFSLDSTLLVSCSEEHVDDGVRKQGKLKTWDAATGTPISMIPVPGVKFAVANDFSTVASFQDNTTMLYNMNGSPSSTMFTTSSKIQKLALSSENHRVAAAWSDRTAIWLCDHGNAKLIDKFDGPEDSVNQLEFSPTGTRLAYSLTNGIKLRDGMSGRLIAHLDCGSSCKFKLSRDGSRIACLSRAHELSLWNSESGRLIAAVTDGGGYYGLAISANGSLLATADYTKVMLWSENRGRLTRLKVLEADLARSMVFSLDNILVMATPYGIKFYNVKTHSFIYTLPLSGTPIALAVSPDYTRLAVGDYDGNVNLWDIRGIDASRPSSKEASSVTALALSRDCSRLACGFKDGTVELWGTSPTMRRMAPLTPRSKIGAVFFHIFPPSRHTESVRALGFDPDDRLFASGSDDGTINLWNGGDGALRGTLKARGEVRAVALSKNVLVASWGTRGRWYDGHEWRRWHDGGVTLWHIATLSVIYTFRKTDDKAFKVSIAKNSNMIAACLGSGQVALIQVDVKETIAIFHVPHDIHTMTFLPDNSQIVIQSNEGVFLSIDLRNNGIVQGPTFNHLVQLPNIPLWHRVPIWHCQEGEQHFFAALFPPHKSPVPVVWIPRQILVTTWTQGSSMIALGCEDGRIVLLRLPTSHVS